MDTMTEVGASMNAFLFAAEPILKLKMELKQFLQVWDEQHMYPWNEDFPFDQWARDLDNSLSSGVFGPMWDGLRLGAATFNNQVKEVRRMVADHPRYKLLPTDMARCPFRDPHHGQQNCHLEDPIGSFRAYGPV